MLSKVQNSLYSNYWSVLCSRGSNLYFRRAVPKVPTLHDLSEHLEKEKSDVSWSKAILIQKTL